MIRLLPLNLGIFSALNHRWIPMPSTLNGYRLKVTGLEAGEDEVSAEDRLLGKYNSKRLARSENIASATSNGWEPGDPWDAQSDAVKEMIHVSDPMKIIDDPIWSRCRRLSSGPTSDC